MALEEKSIGIDFLQIAGLALRPLLLRADFLEGAFPLPPSQFRATSPGVAPEIHARIVVLGRDTSAIVIGLLVVLAALIEALRLAGVGAIGSAHILSWLCEYYNGFIYFIK